MRLAFPRIESLQTDDGTASIRYLTVDMNRDNGGLKYLFTFEAPNGEMRIPTTVALLTSSPAREKFRADTGLDLFDSRLSEIGKYTEEYAGRYGNTFLVQAFDVPANMDEDAIVALRSAFCALFFEYWSSYRHNNQDDTCDPAERYPDTLHFVPQNLGRKFHLTLHARQEG
ncbi:MULTISPECIES: hypothetical protein [unclassified Bradyrhizobium]|uniref:hypothetical protein n=1 Tax=unclassified Bradyrhizobium TaxID=2631580 RepID=UPI0028E7872C|nr:MULTISPECIES: hypothetical protein [unclassified Bradyrhizobium]